MPRARVLLVLILLLGASLRFTGLDWGTDRESGTFHRFHPDETTLIAAAKAVGDDVSNASSAYGFAPAYLLYAVELVSGYLTNFTPFDATRSYNLRKTHVTARAVSALLGTATLFFVYMIGNRAGGTVVGLIAAAWLAFSPGHIQQSHYYTVDVGLTFWVTTALYLMLRTPSNSACLYAGIGVIVGIAGGHRPIAAGLAIPFVVAHIWPAAAKSFCEATHDLRDRLKDVVTRNTVLCLVIAVTATVLSMPSLFLAPETFFGSADQRNFLPSVEVATGKAVRMWNLYDFTTTPYLFYITDLFPAALGYPVTISAAFGLVLGILRPNRTVIVLIAWFVVYFLGTGGLFTKPIRYTTPAVPVLCCLGAYGMLAVTRLLSVVSQRSVLAGLSLIIGLPTLAHGYAVSRVYAKEDIRIEAARWIADNIPKDAAIIGETGGFPTFWMLDDFPNRVTDPGSLFIRTRGHILPGHLLDILSQTVGEVDYWLLIRENRAIPYTSAPQEFPLAARLYSAFDDHSLGYEHVTTFRKPAELFGYRFDRPGTDPTITAFDRPTVDVYRRQDVQGDRWAEWRDAVVKDPTNPDSIILEGITKHKADQFREAFVLFETAIRKFPYLKLAQLCRIESLYMLERPEAAQAAYEAANLSQWDYAGLTLAGLPERGAEYTRVTQTGRPDNIENRYLRQVAAKAFMKLGVTAQTDGQTAKAIEYFEKAIELDRKYLLPFSRLAGLYLDTKAYRKSMGKYQEALDIAPERVDLWTGLAVSGAYLGDASTAHEGAMQALGRSNGDTTYASVLRQVASFIGRTGHPTWASEIEAAIAGRGVSVPKSGQTP